ncbi:hypothetical protein MKW92_018455 [Papaver armeniacum]|nr:hypothetical protein MKW92_018455 [Papaver armeniacum]
MNLKSSIWHGDDPFNYSIPVFLAQASITAFATSAMKFVLEPLGVTSFVAQMIGGLLIGPSFLGKTELFAKKLFANACLYILETVQYFGSMFFCSLLEINIPEFTSCHQ